eukprot:XP_001611218.1 membrane protein [Babesia bovis T2Bo]
MSTLISTLFVCVCVVYVPLLFCAVDGATLSAIPLSPRFTESRGIGVDERVEPYPTIRVYAYTPRGTFNPSSPSYSKRLTRVLESEAYRSGSLGIKGLHSRLLQLQVGYYCVMYHVVLDASEKHG